MHLYMSRLASLVFLSFMFFTDLLLVHFSFSDDDLRSSSSFLTLFVQVNHVQLMVYILICSISKGMVNKTLIVKQNMMANKLGTNSITSCNINTVMKDDNTCQIIHWIVSFFFCIQNILFRAYYESFKKTRKNSKRTVR